MAGTLVITTLSDGTNSTSATNCIQGSAKAWVNWAGSTGTIRGSYNVSSVTRASQGEYTINMTTAMSNANYAICFSASINGSINYWGISENTAPTTSAFAVRSYTNSAAYDPTYCNVSVFR
jgi:hypothetical protein